MSKKIVYTLTLSALAVSIFFLGKTIRGRYAGGNVVGYTALPAIGMAEPAEGSPQNAFSEVKAAQEPGLDPGNTDSDYIKEVPEDYNLSMSALTPKETAGDGSGSAKFSQGIPAQGQGNGGSVGSAGGSYADPRFRNAGSSNGKNMVSQSRAGELTAGKTDPGSATGLTPDGTAGLRAAAAAAAALSSADMATGASQNGSSPGKTNNKTGVNSGNMDSDYIKEVPNDYNLNLQPPTAQEEADIIAEAIKNDPLSASIGLGLLAASYHYLGVPYKLGGDGVHTTDCSMFTRMSAIRAGLEPASFQRGAGIQYGYSLNQQYKMQLISKGNSVKGMQPGDFIFFDWKNEFSRVRPYHIGHVGFYIGPTKGSAIYTIEAGNPVHKGWRNTKYVAGFGRIVKR